jgi:hypothetical protein
MKTILSCLFLTALTLSAQEPGSPVAPPTEIQSLARLIQDQEDKVGEMRKVRDTIEKTRKIIYQGQDPKDESRTEEDISQDELYEKEFHEMGIRISAIELNLARLTYLEGEKLIIEAEKMVVKDNPFRKVRAEKNGDGNSDAPKTAPSRLDTEQKLGELKRLLEKELHDARVSIRKIPLRRAIYMDVDEGYNLEMERLKLMKGALERLMEKQAD